MLAVGGKNSQGVDAVLLLYAWNMRGLYLHMCVVARVKQQQV